MKIFDHTHWQIIRPIHVFLCVGFVLYLNTLGNTWSFDDYSVILYNPDVRSLGNFFENYYPGRPLRELTYLLDYKLFGYNPAGWHVQNILWHALNAYLVYVLANLLIGKSRVAWMAALFFLVHPIHVEVVAQTSHRKDSLSLFFILLATCCYLKFRKEGKWWYAALSIISTIIGCYAKEHVIMAVAVLICYEMVYHGRKPYIFIAIPVFLSAILVRWSISSDEFIDRTSYILMRNGYLGDFDGLLYAYAVMKSWLFLLLKLILPTGLAVNYVIDVPQSFRDPWVVASALMLLTYGLSIVLTWKRWPHACFCLLWIGAFYLPTANILPYNFLAADRYLYAPSVGFFLLAALILDGARISSTIRGAVVMTLIGLCTLLVIRQNVVWNNQASLWTHSLAVNPRSVNALVNVAASAYDERSDEQLALLQKARELNPQFSYVYYFLGRNYEARGDDKEAVKNYCMFFDHYNETFEGSDKFWIDELKNHLREKYHLRL